MLKIKPNYREKISAMISWGHYFTLFNILLALLIGSRYLTINDWPNTFLGRAYSIISWMGHFSFLCFTLYLLIIFPLTFIIGSQRLLRVVYSIIITIALTLLLIDTAIFSYFRLHLNSLVWQLLISSDQTGLNRRWQLLFIVMPVIFLIEMLLATWCWKKLRSLQRRSIIIKPIVTLFVCAFLATHFIYIWADANFYRPITMQRNNFPLSYPMTARRFLEHHGLLDAQRYEQRLIEQGNPDALSIEYPLSHLQFSSQFSQMNLLLILVNQLPAIPDKNLPNLSHFSTQNLRFSHHYSTGITAENSLLGLFYGLSPSYLDSISITRKTSALITALTERHYQFGLFSSQSFATPLYRQALLSDFSLPQQINGKEEATNLSQRWQLWLNQLSSTAPWFSYLTFDNPQMPATHVDQQLGQVFTALQKRKLFSNTVIIITANRSAVSSVVPTEELHVPLIIHWPGQSPAQSNKLTEHQDIMATIMESLLGVTNSSSDYSQGENLFMPERQNPWLLAGIDQQLIAISPYTTLAIQRDGHYHVYIGSEKTDTQENTSLTQLLEIITQEKRFVAN